MKMGSLDKAAIYGSFKRHRGPTEVTHVGVRRVMKMVAARLL